MQPIQTHHTTHSPEWATLHPETPNPGQHLHTTMQPPLGNSSFPDPSTELAAAPAVRTMPQQRMSKHYAAVHAFTCRC